MREKLKNIFNEDLEYLFEKNQIYYFAYLTKRGKRVKFGIEIKKQGGKTVLCYRLNKRDRSKEIMSLMQNVSFKIMDILKEKDLKALIGSVNFMYSPLILPLKIES